LLIKFLYRQAYRDRFSSIGKIIPKNERVKVLDVCCGDSALFRYELRSYSNVDYLGLEMNEAFLKYAKKKSIPIKFCNILIDEIPQSDVIVLQGSLYQFHPECEELIKKLLKSTNKILIISEPIKNLSSSSSRLVSFLAKYSANPGDGHKSFRFDRETFQNFFSNMRLEHQVSFEVVASGRDMLAVISKKI